MSYHPPIANSGDVFKQDLFKGKVLFCTGGELRDSETTASNDRGTIMRSGCWKNISSWWTDSGIQSASGMLAGTRVAGWLARMGLITPLFERFSAPTFSLPCSLCLSEALPIFTWRASSHSERADEKEEAESATR